MSLSHTPLDPSTLSPAAQRALGAGPSKLMAARGIMPLPPADQVAVLYQLSIDADPAIAEAATKTATGLPEKLLAGTLADGALDARILDFFGLLHHANPVVFDAVVASAAVADETVAALAGKAGTREVDLIANNEQRLLRHPEIIAAMYMNRRARMSTIDRVVELAVRNQVRVPGLAAWDEVAHALSVGGLATPQDDEMFAEAAVILAKDDSVLTTGDPNEPVPEAPEEEDFSNFRNLRVSSKVRYAQLGNAFVRAQAIRDPVKIVAKAAIKSPGVTDIEAARYAGNHTLSEDVIGYISRKREWTRLYGVKVALCKNPKTPLPEAAKFLPFLREKDLTNLSKSKGVASALVAQCRKLLMTRGGQKK